jgi:subtilisin family serine protease
MRLESLALAGVVLTGGSAASTLAHAQPTAIASAPAGASLVRLLGARAADAFAARGTRGIGVQVALPAGVRAADVGLTELAPGFGRLRGSPATVLSFADAHPQLAIEVTPPLHTLLDTASTFVAASAAIQEGLDGTGVLVGIADTGLDVTHPDFLDSQQHTRVAWLLDLSSPPLGLHPDLEAQFGTMGPSGAVGAVWSADDINAALASGKLSTLPQDELGHGTLVTSCAAGNGLRGTSPYRGIAPGATILLARVTGSGTDAIDTDYLLLGAAFLFDRATALGQPVVVNLSLGTDFGPHDGTLAWEQTLASYVGPEHPGRALVAAAGNSGSIVDTPVHQNVFVSPGSTMRLPVTTNGAQDGGIQVWVATRAGADISVGLDGPDGTWISPVAGGASAGKTTADYAAGIYNGSQPSGSPVPQQSHGAVVVWQGSWPSGTYQITLSGSGTADLYVQATGDASVAGLNTVGFARAVREGTINLPATNPSIIGVGCTINKKNWRSIDRTIVALSVPVFDPPGGVATGATRDAIDGEPCWFSSAGPTVTGLAKPEMMAPGGAIIGALSQQAVPPAPASIFTNGSCPATSTGAVDPTCQQIDSLHAVSFGTSFSSPIVAGTIAVLLQHDPMLTQDVILAALQGGAHHLRGPALFDDQAGPGEVDVLGAVAAVDRLLDPRLALPDRTQSWLTPSGDYYSADGATPLQAILELRTAVAGTSPPSAADGFAPGRLGGYALVDGKPYPGAVQSLVRRGPGVWVATVQLAAGLGGSSLVLGATFDGHAIVDEVSMPIATDAWTSEYPSTVVGGCAVSGAGAPPGSGAWFACLTLGVALGVRSFAGRPRKAASSRCPRARARGSATRTGR